MIRNLVVVREVLGSIPTGNHNSESHENRSSHSGDGSATRTGRARASARKGISRNNSLSSLNNGQEDDDDEKPPAWSESEKIGKQCENSTKLNLSPIGEPAHDPHSLQITVNQTELSNGTFLGKLSRHLMSTLNNITLFTSHNLPDESIGNDSTFSLNISVSDPDNTVTTWSPPVITVTPAKSEDLVDTTAKSDDELDEKCGDAYFTGSANPIITPVQSGRRSVLRLTPDTGNNRVRSKSFSHNRPYPPSARIKKRLRLKFEHQLFDGTPVRRRSPSESDIDFSESMTIPKHELGCVKVIDEGYHDCSAGKKRLIHLKHDFLQSEDTVSRITLVSEIEKILINTPKAQEGIQATGTFTRSQEVVRRTMEHLAAEDDDGKKIPLNDPLLYLLAKLNLHFGKVNIAEGKKENLAFDTLEIKSMIGRNTKLPLNNAKEADGEPLILLHMGKERAVNIIPKKFNITMMDVFDVQIGNFTILSVFPETLNNLNISLPREKSLADDELDFHILVLLRQVSQRRSKRLQN